MAFPPKQRLAALAFADTILQQYHSDRPDQRGHALAYANAVHGRPVAEDDRDVFIAAYMGALRDGDADQASVYAEVDWALYGDTDHARITELLLLHTADAAFPLYLALLTRRQVTGVLERAAEIGQLRARIVSITGEPLTGIAPLTGLVRQIAMDTGERAFAVHHTKEAYVDAYVAYVTTRGYNTHGNGGLFALLDWTLRRGTVADLTALLMDEDVDDEELRMYITLMSKAQTQSVLDGLSVMVAGQASAARRRLHARISEILIARAMASSVAGPAPRHALPARYQRQTQLAQLCAIAANLAPAQLATQLRRILADVEADIPRQ